MKKSDHGWDLESDGQEGGDALGAVAYWLRWWRRCGPASNQSIETRDATVATSAIAGQVCMLGLGNGSKQCG
ncbi:hypothetical protein [Xanthomonas oryzae]|uniref:hypothetical protein n=1 Tax=Xanthomonas oryzae TaxID=347 RepID=UPI001110C07C|nr:hypothetical protein [Xanthomonas oryzae]